MVHGHGGVTYDLAGLTDIFHGTDHVDFVS